MVISLAPMEGITGHVFRRAHASIYGACDRYYTPFIVPPRPGSDFGKRIKRELDAEINKGFHLIPQVLTKNAQDFLWTAHLLANMGFTEVNLNLGCPSGTVVAKGRGAGFLRDVHALDAFLDEVCDHIPLPLSVKTRLGIAQESEFEQIYAVYKCYPLAELIVHPRLQKDGYRGTPRLAPYVQIQGSAPFPLAYNGDIFTVGDYQRVLEVCPETSHVMVGRGVLTNPALLRMLAGGAASTRDELIEFHDVLFEGYRVEMGSNAVYRMKEWWSYAQFAFSDSQAVHRCVRKARTVDDYLRAVKAVLHEKELDACPQFKGQ